MLRQMWIVHQASEKNMVSVENWAIGHSYYILPKKKNLPTLYQCPRNLNEDNCQSSGLSCFEGEI